jgi:holo-[acyl-carrier protein] synthase
MILGVGLDVVETAQIERLLAGHGARFADRVFTEGERRACSGRVDAAQAFAARFAAKEACFKALGIGLGYGMSFLHVEVVRANGGQPELRLTGPAAGRAQERGVRRIHVSLSHQPGIAAATVILED